MVVDAEKGLGVISRSVVPFDLGVLTLTFADSVIVPGKVPFLPPAMNKISLIFSGRISASDIGNRSHLMGSKITRRHKSSISKIGNRIHSPR